MRGQIILEPKLPAKSIRGDSCGRRVLALRFGSRPSRSCFLSTLNLLRLSPAEAASCTEAWTRFSAVTASCSLWIKTAVMVFLMFEGVRTMELGKASLRSSP